MKAISIKQPWASMIANGTKMIETRLWPTKYRGDLLIAATKNPKINGLPTGQALCIAELWDCLPMVKDNEAAACCELYEGAYAWYLKNIRKIKPFAVRGKLGLYEIKNDLIEFVR